jgi:drug/metabolite transporter (DMT)-like permease
MPYFYLVASVFFIASSSIFGSFFNRKNEDKKDPTPLYNLLLSAVALVGWWVLYALDFSFNPASIIYSVIFAVGYAVADIGIILALATGPVSLTSLILQLSLIGATIWGFVFEINQCTSKWFLGFCIYYTSL